MKVKIKKLKINKIFKITLTITTILTIVALSFLLYKEVKVPKINEEKVKLYSYINKSSTDYKVLLKPNNLYNTPSLNEGKYYITNYVDSINTTFNYEYNGDRRADISGYYEVSAVVEGYIEIEKKHITIWESKFALSPKTDFTNKDGKITLTKSVDIKLSEYNNFAGLIAEESEVQIPMQLNVYMDVNLKADTDKGPVEAGMTPQISIPLDESYFSITESEAKEEPGSIEETRKVQLPPNKHMVILYQVGMGIMALIAMALVIFTESFKKSPFIKQLDKIFKMHGSRLVALSSELLASSLESCSIVRSIDDLVRVADELGRPIMYEYSEEYKEMVHFYVVDDKRTYLYILRDRMVEASITVNDEKEVAL